jgi:hypothetical protein
MARAGEALRTALARAVAAAGLNGTVSLVGHPTRMALVTAGEARAPPRLLRALFVQALLDRGLYAPARFVPSLAFDEDVPLREGGDALAAACQDVAAALERPHPGTALRGELPQAAFRLR